MTRVLGASWIAVAVAALTLVPAHAQSCDWGGDPTVAAPTATLLRAEGASSSAPTRFALDASGNLYVTDPLAGEVIVIDRFGQHLETRADFLEPLGIAVSPSGTLFVAERQAGRVRVLDDQWQTTGELGQGGREFVLPNDIALDPDPQFDRVYVADSGAHSIKVYSSAGDPLFAFGGPGTGEGQLDFPASLHVSAAGEIWVADQNHDRLQVFDRDGNFLRCIGSSGSTIFTRKFGRIQGITTDDLGRVYVADAFQGHVVVLDPAGATLATIGDLGEAPGQLRTPMDVAIDADNRLYVTSVNNARVEIFGLDGYSDPQAIQAIVSVSPIRVGRSARPRWVSIYIEVPGSELETIDVSSTTANGVPAEPGSGSIGDHDGNGTPDMELRFDSTALLAGATGDVAIAISGLFQDGTPFGGTETMIVQSRGKPVRPGPRTGGAR